MKHYKLPHDPYAAGWDAFQIYPSPCNPFPANSPEHQLWESGFEEACRESRHIDVDEACR